MTIELIALPGSVLIATAVIAKVHERRRDVLYGPYIEGRDAPRLFSGVMDWLTIEASNLRQSVARLGWRVRNISYVASATIC
jgi:hypothetical protein